MARARRQAGDTPTSGGVGPAPTVAVPTVAPVQVAPPPGIPSPSAILNNEYVKDAVAAGMGFLFGVEQGFVPFGAAMQPAPGLASNPKFQVAQAVGNVVGGVAGAFTGGEMVGTSPAVAAGSGGAALPLAVAQAGVGLAMAANGVKVAAKGVAMLAERARGAAEATAALPELEISAARNPQLAENIQNALNAGHPDVLTHGGDAVANRAASLRDVPNIPGLTRDEYPFASSMEGGGGAWVGHIQGLQNSSGGGILARFLQTNNILPGMQYRVVVVP